MSLFAAVVGLLTGVVLVLGWRRVRRDLPPSSGVPRVDDRALERILEEGRIEADEPLDLDRVRDEERRFWEEERWDDAEEW
jgi:hypothetical protein